MTFLDVLLFREEKINKMVVILQNKQQGQRLRTIIEKFFFQVETKIFDIWFPMFKVWVQVFMNDIKAIIEKHRSSF